MERGAEAAGRQTVQQMRGRFITFEGGEGAGKSTQAAALARKLGAFGIEVARTREPGGSPGAEIIRHVLLSGMAKDLGAEAEALLFAAARADHLDTLIKPALAAGRWVVCDRFLDSTRIYQGVLGHVARPLLRALERVTVGDALPDLTFVLDLPAKIGLARARERRGSGPPDRFETENLGFHEALNSAFRDLASAEPQRCVLIDATPPADKIAAEIWRQVCKRLHAEVGPMALEEFPR
jgi:dTMP kinase